jgi:hypothetical protein
MAGSVGPESDREQDAAIYSPPGRKLGGQCGYSRSIPALLQFPQKRLSCNCENHNWRHRRMIARELERLLVEYSGYRPADIDQRTRALRAEGRIPSGPRGRNAPDLSPSDIATVLLTMTARRAKDGASIASRAGELLALQRPPEGYALLLKEALVTVIEGKIGIFKFEIRCDGEMAWADYTNHSNTLFLRRDHKMRKILKTDFTRYYEAHDESYCGHWLVLSSALFAAIRRRIGARVEHPSPAEKWVLRRAGAQEAAQPHRELGRNIRPDAPIEPAGDN